MKLFIVSALLISTSAFAWGPTGHRTVGEIAEKYMNPKSLLAARTILQGNSLARVATWPDEIRSDPAHYSNTYPWHYTDWADDAHDHDESASSGKLMGAINDQLAVLKDANATREQKEFSLKFVVHLIGDLHQPLHVGNGLDQGGNLCKVSYMGQTMNLHSVWDEGLINYTNLSFSEIAKFVSAGKTAADMNLARSGSPLDWARESKELRAKIYPANVVEPQAPMSIKAYCQRDVPADQTPKLSYDYAYQFMPILEQRLFLAGVRLAMLLDQVLQ
jgi:hypothetical protein